jgi:hypothetical protein
MSRLTLCCLIALAAAVLSASADESASKPVRPKIGLLTAPITFEANEDPKATLGALLDQLATRHEINFDVNEAAFKADGFEDVLETRVAEKRLPGPKRTTLDAVLRKLLARVPGSGATYLLRRDRIEITTVAAMREEIWGADYAGPFLPLVHAEFDKKPLVEALDELASASGFNVVIDARMADQAKTPVSVRLLNTPLDTAVRLLADMAELKTFQTDNLLYVTSPENAGKLEAAEREKVASGEPGTVRRGSVPTLRPAPGM